MTQLGTTEYMLKGRHQDGPIGERYVVQSQTDNLELLADLVRHEDDECLAAVCRNAERTRRLTQDSRMANVLETGWHTDGRYFQILELSPNATAVSEGRNVMADPELLAVAKSLVGSLKHLHSNEMVHAALAPTCVYKDRDIVRLGELWFVHNADGVPLYDQLSQYFPATVPEFAWQFMAPEVLLGYPPMRESDIFSIGAVLFYLVSGETPRDLSGNDPQGEMLDVLSEAPIKSLPHLCPDLDGVIGGMILGMLAIDPGERPSIFMLEDLCGGPVEESASGDEELEEALD